MIKKEYPWLPGGDEAGVVAVRKGDARPGEFLMELKAKGKLDTAFAAAPKSVAYHLPCHLKVQNIGFKSRDLLALTGAAVTMVEKCSGHDGTWAMKAEYFDEIDEGREEALRPDWPRRRPRSSPRLRPGRRPDPPGDGRSGEAPDELLRDSYGIVE